MFEFFIIIIALIIIGIVNICIRNRFSYLDAINLSKLNEIFIVGGFAPERVESLQYLSSIFIYPILVSLLMYYSINNLDFKKIAKQTLFLYKMITYIILILIGSLLYLDVTPDVDYVGYNYPLNHPIGLIFLTTVLIIWLLIHNNLSSFLRYIINKINIYISRLFIFIVVFFNNNIIYKKYI